MKRFFPAICALLFSAACDRGPEARSILDAAALYSEYPAAFETIRSAYPGPFPEFARIPARDPADATDRDNDFLKRLQREIPVDFIDFHPIGDADGDWGGDEIDVVLKRYGAGDKWITVSLVYFSVPLSIADNDPNVLLFKTCDQKAADWLGDKPPSVTRTAFCQINSHWYAYQKVE
ncbi:hypothetical protein [Hyphococcus sp.]|uniref:hypothetical protein n=1 Tax=Hyphococcus sp. TaxID=2038636 RepID=UPI003CCB8D0E